MIESNLLVSNGKLPATRELSKLLGVSRNSVITAYENLEEKGILYTVKRRGTFVWEIKSIKFANTRKGYWRIANSAILNTTLTNQFFNDLGLKSLTHQYINC